MFLYFWLIYAVELKNRPDLFPKTTRRKILLTIVEIIFDICHFFLLIDVLFIFYSNQK